MYIKKKLAGFLVCSLNVLYTNMASCTNNSFANWYNTRTGPCDFKIFVSAHVYLLYKTPKPGKCSTIIIILQQYHYIVFEKHSFGPRVAWSTAFVLSTYIISPLQVHIRLCRVCMVPVGHKQRSFIAIVIGVINYYRCFEFKRFPRTV